MRRSVSGCAGSVPAEAQWPPDVAARNDTYHYIDNSESSIYIDITTAEFATVLISPFGVSLMGRWIFSLRYLYSR